VLEDPKVIETSERHVQARLTETVTLYCLFSAPILSGVTEAIWVKDGLVINSSSHYVITTLPHYIPTGETTVLTNLTIVNFATGDSGDYSCLSYYNPNKVTSSKTIVSDPVHFNVDEGAFHYMQKQSICVICLGGKTPFKGGVEVGIACAAVVAIIIVVAIFGIHHFRRHRHCRDEESKQ